MLVQTPDIEEARSVVAGFAADWDWCEEMGIAMWLRCADELALDLGGRAVLPMSTAGVRGLLARPSELCQQRAQSPWVDRLRHEPVRS